MSRIYYVPIALLTILMIALSSANANTTPQIYFPCGTGNELLVTYLSVTPSFVSVGDKLTIIFRVASFTPSGDRGACVSACAHAGTACRAGATTKAELDACNAAEAACKDGCGQPYTPPSHSPPVSGIGQASFLLTSPSTQQTREFANTPVLQGSEDNEYRAVIQITQDSPTGNVWLYVKARSLEGSVYGRPVIGPAVDTSSQQTDDTSGTSQIAIGTSEIPSPTASSTAAGLLIAPIVLAALVLAFVAIRRTRRPAKT